MNVRIRAQGVRMTAPLRDYIERRLRFATDRFAGRIGRVDVYVADANGPKGGVDKVCRMSADLLGAGRVEVEETQAGLVLAIYRAARRIGHAITRHSRSRRDHATLRRAGADA